MKNFKLLIISSLIIPTFFACGDFEDERLDVIVDNAIPSYVRFNEAQADTITRGEDVTDTLNFTISLGVRIYEDLNMRVNLLGTAIYGTDYTIVNNSDDNDAGEMNAQFTLADDKSFVDIFLPRNDTLTSNRATIGILLKKDGLNDGNKTVTLELASASAQQYGQLRLGRLEGELTKSISIVDIDCPIDVSFFTGDFSYQSASFRPPAARDKTLKAGTNPDEIIIEDFDDLAGALGSAGFNATLKFNDDYSIEPFDIVAPGVADLLGAVETWTMKVTGSFTTCPGSEGIVINISWVDGAGAPQASSAHVYTKK